MLAINRWSSTFFKSMDKDDGKRLCDRVQANKNSLRAFAITRKIRYLETYQNSIMPEKFGQMDNFNRFATTAQMRDLSHPHLYYVTSNRDIVRSRFIQPPAAPAVMRDTDEVIYTTNRMKGKGPQIKHGK